MMPVILRIGDFRLTSYVALIALAGIVTLFYFKRFESQLGLSNRGDFWFLANVIGVSGFLGGRLHYLLAGHFAFADVGSFLAALVSNETGLSTFGALLGALSGAAYCSWRLKINFLRLIDYVCLVIPIGHAIARVGCFLTGCCYGRAVHGHLPWAVVFTDRSSSVPPELLGVPLHPTQLYESAGDLLLAGILYYFVRPWTTKSRFGPGIIAAGYVTGYALLRYINESFRANPELWPGTSVPAAQVYSLGMIPVAAMFLYFAAKWRSVPSPFPSTP